MTEIEYRDKRIALLEKVKKANDAYRLAENEVMDLDIEYLKGRK